jgi:hypothetical protein
VFSFGAVLRGPLVIGLYLLIEDWLRARVLIPLMRLLYACSG